MSQKQRLFVALFPPKSVSQALHTLALNVARHANGREVPESNLHITLKFIGNADAAMQRCVENGLEQIKAEPVTLHLANVQHQAKQRMIWTLFDQCPQSLHQLVSELERVAVDCGAPSSSRPYVPHITLARNVRRTPGQLPVVPELQVTFNQFVLVRSQTFPQGSRYSILRRWSLSVGQ